MILLWIIELCRSAPQYFSFKSSRPLCNISIDYLRRSLFSFTLEVECVVFSKINLWLNPVEGLLSSGRSRHLAVCLVTSMANRISKAAAKNIWIDAQKLNQDEPFGTGSMAVHQAISHLGYVQIDTIHVIERCHHHILYNRIPNYHPKDLWYAQTIDKKIFEYWTHALAYISVEDFRYFMPQMKAVRPGPGSYFSSVTESDMKKVKDLLKKQGPISIRDIKDDVLIEKEHAWASAKPSKRALQLGFYKGDFVISERVGMLKKYDLTSRHFAWKHRPKAVASNEYTNYILERALRTQGVVNLESICHLAPRMKPLIAALIQKKLKTNEILELKIEGLERVSFFASPRVFERKVSPNKMIHILSPFDPLVIQRKRLKMFFGYDHLFEAYIPKGKRKIGYFTLPVLREDNIVALLDLKTDRLGKKVQIQNWVWLKGFKSPENKRVLERELDRFEKFQLWEPRENDC